GARGDADAWHLPRGGALPRPGAQARPDRQRQRHPAAQAASRGRSDDARCGLHDDDLPLPRRSGAAAAAGTEEEGGRKDMNRRRAWWVLAFGSLVVARPGWGAAPPPETAAAVEPVEDAPYDPIGRRDPFRPPHAASPIA